MTKMRPASQLLISQRKQMAFFIVLKVCEGLAQELMEAKISVWPGYLKTLPTSMELLNAK